METDTRSETRRRILKIATDLLERDGVAALSTRSVAAAADIRAASLYQLFGDKNGLLTALAVDAFDTYLATKQGLTPTDDPVETMRLGWDAHVEFGLDHPAFYLLMFGSTHPGDQPPVAEQARTLLLGYLDGVAGAGRLTVPPAAAARLLQAGVTGVTLALIAEPADRRDLDLSVRMRDIVIGSLVTDTTPTPRSGLAAHALALDSAIAAEGDAVPALRASETTLLREWLECIARQ